MFKITNGIRPRRGGTVIAEETGNNTGEQRWKSQRRKIHRLAYRFSIELSLLGLAYGFLS
jgi:hypothetical protein